MVVRATLIRCGGLPSRRSTRRSSSRCARRGSAVVRFTVSDLLDFAWQLRTGGRLRGLLDERLGVLSESGVWWPAADVCAAPARAESNEVWKKLEMGFVMEV